MCEIEPEQRASADRKHIDQYDKYHNKQYRLKTPQGMPDRYAGKYDGQQRKNRKHDIAGV
jgi:hypothetical protein